MYKSYSICKCNHRHELHTTNINGLSKNGMCIVDGCKCMEFQEKKGGDYGKDETKENNSEVESK